MERQPSLHMNCELKSRRGHGKRGEMLLHMAGRIEDSEYVEKILLDCHGDYIKDLVCKQNKDGETAMYVAAKSGNVGTVGEILKVSGEQAADFKANNEVLKELLHAFPSLAMTTNSSNLTDVVNLLLRDTSLAKISCSNGKTTLHSAARMGHTEVVRSILIKDPEICLRTDKKGQTALHMAIKGNSIEVVSELLKIYPSLVSMKDNKGNTPLHIATKRGCSEILESLLPIDGIDVNAVNRAGETALGIAEKSYNEEITPVLREVGIAEKSYNPAKQLNRTVSDIKHDVQSQLRQTRQTEKKVHRIKHRLGKLHLEGLNNAINSSTVVAVLIASIAFAALFTCPGEYVEEPKDGFALGQAYIGNNAIFIVFLLFDSLALFISLAVVVVQTSIIIVEKEAKKQMVSVINKLMWLACLFTSISFVSLTYIVVSRHEWWLAWATAVIGASIMLITLGSMLYCMIIHRINQNKWNANAYDYQSYSGGVSVESDPELLSSEHKRMYAL